MPDHSAKHTQPQRIAYDDRRFVPPSPEVGAHIYAEQLRLHDCDRPTPTLLTCPTDGCSRLILCEHCGYVISLLLPPQGWCDTVEDERQHLTAP